MTLCKHKHIYIGIYGIRVNKTIIDGKKAKKKLNANDDARVVIAPCLTPL